jgi:hypothetical protein
MYVGSIISVDVNNRMRPARRVGPECLQMDKMTSVGTGAIHVEERVACVFCPPCF